MRRRRLSERLSLLLERTGTTTRAEVEEVEEVVEVVEALVVGRAGEVEEEARPGAVQVLAVAVEGTPGRGAAQRRNGSWPKIIQSKISCIYKHCEYLKVKLNTF